MSECYHKWKFVGRWCQECGEFTEGHGEVLSQCELCGIIWGCEWGYMTKDEIDNFKFMEQEIPHLIEIIAYGDEG